MHRHTVPSAPPRPPAAPKDSAPRRYMGAPTFLADDGYLWEWCPGHPRAAHGVVLQHRLVVEVSIGRFLSKAERVHHRNHCRWDNRPENLELFGSHADHMRAHWAGRGRNDPAVIAEVLSAAADPTRTLASVPLAPASIRAICLSHGVEWVPARGDRQPLTEAMVREAVRERSTREAAAHLGVSVSALYRQFGQLLRKRPSPGALDPHRSEVIRLAYVERQTHAQIAQAFGVSVACVHKSIRRWRSGDPQDAPARQRPGPKPGSKRARNPSGTAQPSP